MQINEHHEPLWRRLSVLLVLALIVGSSVVVARAARAQPPFAPPPGPRGTPSAVRGVYDPTRHVASPATIAPAAAKPPASSPGGLTTTGTAKNATPLEGGEIIARIDGQIVLASDVMWQVNKILEANADRIPPGQREQFVQKLLRQQLMGVVDTKLLYADFRRKVPAENLPTIEQNLADPFEEVEIPRLLEMLELDSRKELDAELKRLGTSIADMQQQFNERTIAGEWLRQLAPKPKEVTYDELVAYYRQQVEEGEYDYPAQARWEELMIRFDRHRGDRDAAWRALAEMGNQVWQRVAANPSLRGAVFTTLAKEKSHGFTAKKGGQHDWTTQGALKNKNVDQALFTLEIGQLSDILESPDGFHIVRVLQRKQAGRTPFTEAQASIRKKLVAQRKQVLIQAELKKLRQQCRVWTIFDGNLSGPRVAEMLDRPTRR